MARLRVSLAVVAIIALMWGVEAGWAAEPTAQQILDSITSSNTFSGSGQAAVELTVISKQGQKKVQKLDIYRSDDGKGTTKQLVVFTAPADVKGTKFLSLTSPKEGTQMWLYLPVLGRERVIAGSAVQGKFMGTDFTFEEISGDITFAKEYTAKRLEDKVVDGQDCYGLKLTPKKSGNAYGSLVMAVHKQSRVPLLIEFYDRSQKILKVLKSSDLRKNTKGEWQPYAITLSDQSSGSSTTVRLLSMSEKNVSDEVFTLRYLRR